jgi:hypothetical protein
MTSGRIIDGPEQKGRKFFLYSNLNGQSVVESDDELMTVISEAVAA